MSAKELFYLWLLAYGAALVAFVARISWVLFGVASEPPDDPKDYKKWKRKRIWLLMSEFFALPLFATTAVLATARGWIDPIMAMLYAMICGVLGIAFFIRATKKIVSDKLGLKDEV